VEGREAGDAGEALEHFDLDFSCIEHYDKFHIREQGLGLLA
jgi:hypothetical protein